MEKPAQRETTHHYLLFFSDFSSQLFYQIIKTANEILSQSAGAIAVPRGSQEAQEVMTWLTSQEPKTVAACILALDIKWLTDGTKCRISISMPGFPMRSQVIQTMTSVTGVERQIGAPPAGRMERDLGDYCKRFSRLTLGDEF